MKSAAGSCVLVCLVCLVVAFAVAGTATAEAPAAAPGAATSSVPLPLIGRAVRIYFRQDEKIGMKEVPGATLTFLTGTVRNLDTAFVTLVDSEGTTYWVPIGSVAYIRGEDGPATRAATRPS